MTELVEFQNGKHEQAVVYNAAGRAIRYVVFGARDLKRVVFYSHGFPASRVEAGLAHTAARERGITVVALDRPGFGGSAWYGERSFQDWADDVVTVANHLGVERFGVLGVSGGTPTAVAAAGALSERVTKLVIVSGMGPLAGREVLAGMNIGNRALLELGLCMPNVARYSIALIARLRSTTSLSRPRDYEKARGRSVVCKKYKGSLVARCEGRCDRILFVTY
jgi:pimeloyl-ACP methyl ester carboxylesterase